MTELQVSDLLQPIRGENPAGADLRYSATYEQIKEARREDDELAQGAWQRERKTADYRTVIQLGAQALKEKSKDLQIAAWLTEALLREQGYAGFRSGLELCLGLLERFWEGLYPALEDGDAELRAAPLAWLGSKLVTSIKNIPLTEAGYDWFAYKQSRAIGYESPSATPEQKKAREKALSEGKLSAEAFDKALEATPRKFYLQAERHLNQSLEILRALDDLCADFFGEAAPGFTKTREALAEVRHTVQTLLSKKGGADPETESAAPQPEKPASAEPLPLISATSETKVQTATDSLTLAMQALRAGQHQQALQLLSREAATQASGRGRFLRKLELARACISAGKDAIAQPLLDDLAALIDTHKLDEWEEHETIAGALVTILQASKRVQSDAKEKQRFFERICRLDPSQALSCQP